MYQGEVRPIENSSVSKLKGDCDLLLLIDCYCDGVMAEIMCGCSEVIF